VSLQRSSFFQQQSSDNRYVNHSRGDNLLQIVRMFFFSLSKYNSPNASKCTLLCLTLLCYLAPSLSVNKIIIIKQTKVQPLPAGFNSSVESYYQKVVSGHFWGFLQLGDLLFFKVTLIAENHFSLQSITIPESLKFSVSLTFFAMNLRLCLPPFLSFL
jgi:hypothetical protein